MRIGQGFDVHALVAGRKLVIGGVEIAHDKGLLGHSDADVVLHAITDALLGAAGFGDIGEHFPPSDPQWKGASSDLFLRHAAQGVREPKVGPHRSAIRTRVAEILAIKLEQVSVKATTTEGLGFTGRREGMAAQAVASIRLGIGK